MSYILAALRKSDEKRNALNLPPHGEHRDYPQEAKNHRTLWAVSALLIAAAGGWFLAQSVPTETAALPVSNSEPDRTTVIAETGKPQAEHQPQQASIIAAAPVPEPSAKPDQTLRKQKNQHAQAQINQDAANTVSNEQASDNPDSAILGLSSIPSSLLTEDHEPAVANEHIPSRSELPLEKQNILPAIDIAGHIYDDNPSARMVIVNGKVRREKQFFGDGLKLEEITAQGIILSYRGIVFRMGIFD